MTAEEIMTTEVATVDETGSIGDAMEILAEMEIRHLPVTRGGELVGMISDRDLRDAGLSRLADLADLENIEAQKVKTVTEIMSGDVITVDPSTSVPEIINLMVTEKVGAVPVVDQHQGNLVGMISYLDVLRAASSLLGE